MIVQPANVVMTAHAAHSVDEQPHRMTWIIDCLARHDQGDWGDLDPDDHAANNHALRHRDGRVLSRSRWRSSMTSPTTTQCGSSPTTSTTPTHRRPCSGQATTERVDRYPRHMTDSMVRQLRLVVEVDDFENRRHLLPRRSWPTATDSVRRRRRCTCCHPERRPSDVGARQPPAGRDDRQRRGRAPLQPKVPSCVRSARHTRRHGTTRRRRRNADRRPHRDSVAVLERTTRRAWRLAAHPLRGAGHPRRALRASTTTAAGSSVATGTKCTSVIPPANPQGPLRRRPDAGVRSARLSGVVGELAGERGACPGDA
jgi:hypothetical protein